MTDRRHHGSDTRPNPSELSPQTIMLAAFEGWNDAGGAASSALNHLRELWQTSIIAQLKSDDYYDFQVNRPTTQISEAGHRLIEWPTTTVSVGVLASKRRVIMVGGAEPSMRWHHFCDELLQYAAREGVSTLITMGALLADVPHTRPIPVTATTEHAPLQDLLHLNASAYEGPTGILGVLNHQALSQDLASVSLWAAVPHYAAQAPSPYATTALLRQLSLLINEPIDLGLLAEQAQQWTRGVDELARDNETIAAYVRELEQAEYSRGLSQATGDVIAREFERYLRRDDPESTPGHL